MRKSNKFSCKLSRLAAAQLASLLASATSASCSTCNKWRVIKSDNAPFCGRYEVATSCHVSASFQLVSSQVASQPVRPGHGYGYGYDWCLLLWLTECGMQQSSWQQQQQQQQQLCSWSESLWCPLPERKEPNGKARNLLIWAQQHLLQLPHTCHTRNSTFTIAKGLPTFI